MSIKSYEDLEVWKAGIELAARIYGLTAQFPKSETYGLASQLQRSAVSISSNLAEGSARGTTREFLRFIGIALGSLAELKTQLVIASKVNLLKESDYERISPEIDRIGKMLSGLQSTLRAKLATSHQPPATGFREEESEFIYE